jgi:hypothetical protein
MRGNIQFHEITGEQNYLGRNGSKMDLVRATGERSLFSEGQHETAPPPTQKVLPELGWWASGGPSCATDRPVIAEPRSRRIVEIIE